MRTGEKLKNMREARGLSLRALSDQLGKHGTLVSAAAIQKWEIGETSPSKDNLKSICSFFNVDPGWLLFDVTTSDLEARFKSLLDNLRLLNSNDLEMLEHIVAFMTRGNKDQDSK